MVEFGKKLGNLSLAVLENFVEKNLGKKFVDELRSPTDRALKIQSALENVEDRFQKEFEDKDLYHSMFIGLPIDNIKVGGAIGKFFDRPTDSDFPKILTQLLTSEFKKLSQPRIDTAVSFYIKVLKQELAIKDEEFREKIRALADLETLEHIKEISKNIRQPERRVETTSPKEVIEPLVYKNDSNLHPVGDLPFGSHLPFPPNALFTGPEKELKKLADALLDLTPNPSPERRGESVVITQAVTGMGGLGKTQLTIEFGYRYGKYFRGVHWLNLADVTQLDSEIANCGRRMFTNDFPEDQPSQVALTLQTWKSNGPNLLILDNFEEPSQANHVLTKLRHSNIRILVTSRRTDWSQNLGLSQLKLDLFSPEESLKFLKDSLTNRKDSQDDLKDLAERLGHLPLGLELASRYLNVHQRLSISDYLTQAENALDHASMKNWRADLPAATGHDLDLQRTFALSWKELSTAGRVGDAGRVVPKERIETETTAQKLFMTAGYLAPNEPIPLEIFERTIKISPEKCDEALNLLYGLGLLRKTDSQFPTPESQLPTIHPLLCEYARSLAKEYKEILETLADALATLSNEANNTGIPANFIPLRPHIPVLATHAEDAKLQNAGTLWNNYGFHLKAVADYQGARAMFERALIIDETEYGAVHLNVGIDVNNLGGVLLDLGNLHNSKEMFERAIKILEANLGIEHPQVAVGVNNLGGVLLELGDLRGAKGMYERAVKILEANFGTKHPQVATGINNLGTVLQALGDLHGAKTLYERALEIDETNFGADHPNMAYDVNSLGGVLQDLGDLNGAKALYERAIKILETNFGTDHPQVATSINNLGSVLQALGDLHGAKEMAERAIKIWENNLGTDHPQVATGVNNLGSVLQALGDLHTAKEMYERSLEIRKKFFPPDHPSIKITQGNLDSLNKN